MFTSSKLTVATPDGCHCSASTIASERAMGSHELMISDHCETMRFGVGKYHSSAAFLVGGHTWSIRYYPDGYDSSSKDFISFLLEPINYEGDISVLFRFCLLDQFHVSVETPSTRDGWHSNIFSSTAHKPSGSPYFVSRQALCNSPHLVDGTFRIRCEVIVTVVKIHADVPFLKAPSQDLHRHLGDLLQSKVGADVTFEVCGELFMAHRIVLAFRSPVFMAQFFGPMKEEEASLIRIEDMDASVFQAMLHFVYTDTLPEFGNSDRILMAQHLLVAADRYNLERLKRNCEDVLGSYVDTDTVATTLAIAEQHGCIMLKEVCLKFILTPGNFIMVRATDGFHNLKTSCPSLVQELLNKKFGSSDPSLP